MGEEEPKMSKFYVYYCVIVSLPMLFQSNEKKTQNEKEEKNQTTVSSPLSQTMTTKIKQKTKKR